MYYCWKIVGNNGLFSYSWETDLLGSTKWRSLSHVQLFVTLWTIQSMEFSRPEYWSGWPFPSPGDLPNPGIKPRSPTLLADSLPAEPQGRPKVTSSSLQPWLLQARILEWVAFPFSRVSSQPRNQTGVSCIAGGFFTSWATKEDQNFTKTCKKNNMKAKNKVKGSKDKENEFLGTTPT